MTETRQIAGLTATVHHTGGNCTALQIDLPGGREILITDIDGNGPPVEGDLCFIGVYGWVENHYIVNPDEADNTVGAAEEMQTEYRVRHEAICTWHDLETTVKRLAKRHSA